MSNPLISQIDPEDVEYSKLVFRAKKYMSQIVGDSEAVSEPMTLLLVMMDMYASALKNENADAFNKLAPLYQEKLIKIFEDENENTKH
jgi:hypothetical protein